jgi:hypothetical protein
LPKPKGKYQLISPPQTVEYNVLHALETGQGQAHFAEKYLRKQGISYTTRQIYGAMQRLRKAGLIAKERGIWVLTPNA